MQPDDRPTPTTSTSTSYGDTYPMTEYPMTEGRQFTDYMSEAGGMVYTGTTRMVTYFVDRPLLTGSMIFGGIGAFLGSRLAYVLAERRRKSPADRAMERIALFTETLGEMLAPKNRERAMKQISSTGRTLVDRGQSLGSTVMERIPIDRVLRMEEISMEEKPSTMRQIGYGLSLIPVALALVRNPLVRDFAYRFTARRIRSRRRR